MTLLSTSGKLAVVSIGGDARGIVAIGGGRAQGVLAIGGGLSVGVIAIGVNAVGGLFAAGVNAAGLFVLSPVNGVGVVVFAAVNALGAVAAGRVNVLSSGIFGLIAGVLGLVFTLGVPWRRRAREALPETVGLDALREGTPAGWVRATLVEDRPGDPRGVVVVDVGSERQTMRTSERAGRDARGILDESGGRPRPVLVRVVAEERVATEAGDGGYREAPPTVRELVASELRALPSERFLDTDEDLSWFMGNTFRVAAAAVVTGLASLVA